MKPRPTITITFHGTDGNHSVWDVEDFDNLTIMLEAFEQFRSNHGGASYEFGIED